MVVRVTKRFDRLLVKHVKNFYLLSQISRSLAHLTADVQGLITAVESMARDLGDLRDVVNQMSGQQQTLVTVLALSSSGGGGGGYYGREMWKRETDAVDADDDYEIEEVLS